MSTRIFIDSDVILDVALAREPFVAASRAVLARCEQGVYLGCISGNSVANMYYVLRKLGGDAKARQFITQLLRFLTVIPVDHAMIRKAVESNFADFEDAIQHEAALSFGCELIVTRNVADYKTAQVAVRLPSNFI